MKIFGSLSRCMFAVALASTGCFDEGTQATKVGTSAATVHGAIFTTTVDGTRVNANIFPAKTAVYLDGGPQGGSPSTAASLPPGDYFFQVTDPSGKDLLSTDHVSCRRVRVNAAGVIDLVYAGTDYVMVSSAWTPVSCQHAQGTDTDQAALGALTVQLFPYLDTTNNGGEYKVWMTPVAEYTGNPTFVPTATDDDVHDVGRSGGNSYGFVNSASKTDNFKIKAPVPGEVTPICGDDNVDSGEQCDDGNQVNDDGCSSTCTIELPPPPPPACGDGAHDQGEACDDGNTSNGDGCSATCTIELPPPPPPVVCGDGVKHSSEACDDGNAVNGDGCSATCSIELPPPPPPAPVCGDGMKDSSEACDDGNAVNGDGCSATCTIELPPPPPKPCCGNGIIEAGETCDDGNTTGGDGCSSVCY